MFECNKKTILKSSQKWTKRAKKWPEGGLKREKEKKDVSDKGRFKYQPGN